MDVVNVVVLGSCSVAAAAAAAAAKAATTDDTDNNMMRTNKGTNKHCRATQVVLCAHIYTHT